MATYIPNATQTTEPVESRTVESAALEFRTLKTSINARIEDVQANVDAVQDNVDTEIVNRIAGDANLQTQNNAQDVRLTAIENALLSLGEGGLPGTVYVQRFSGTGVQTAFTLNATPQSGNAVDIYVNGLYQNKDTFSVAGAVITFSEAPQAGTDNIEVQVTVTIALGETDASLVTYNTTTVEAQLDAISAVGGSSLVGFQQAGTGSGVRTAQDKMREWVSVKDFGAVGDGVTDDTAAIQAAHNTGHSVYYPNGTYKITDTITVSIYARIIGESSNGVVINNTNNSVYAYQHLTVIGGPYDVDSGLEIGHMTINSKYGIRLNQSGDFATVFGPQGAIKRIHLHDLTITGTYVNGIDANQDTAVVPTPTEMEGYGVGIRLTKVFDSKIELCKIEFCGIGILMDGCDINTISTHRLNKNGWHLYYFGHDTWGGQSKFRDNDCLYNRRVGAVYLYNTIFATVEDNYFENYSNSATFLRTQTDVGTRFIGNRIDDPKVAVPIISMDPYVGGIITENRYTRPSTYVLSLGYITVGSTYYDWNVQAFTKIYGNQSGFPSCDSPFVLLAPDVDGTVFKYSNCLKFTGAASEAMPFTVSPASSRYVLKTSVGNADIRLSLTPGKKFYRLDYTGRYVAGAGYHVISHVSPSGTVTSLGIAGYLGFPSSGTTVTISETVAIPDVLSLSGFLQITLVNTEVEYESVVLSVTDTLIADAAPSGGAVAYQVGMRVKKLTPQVGQPKGWICTVSGVPGTWASEGNL